MSITTFSLDFQGQAHIDGHVDEAGLDLLRREAFPRSPPLDPTTVGSAETPWRAFKLAPMPDHRLLVTLVSERGNTDSLGRPVSSATGCLLSADDLQGPMRDIGTVWRALDHLAGEAPPAADALVASVCQHSPLHNDAAFSGLAERFVAQGTFLAAAAAALTPAESVLLHLPMDASARRILLPVLLLVPIGRLLQLHLATGSEPSDHRERILGVARVPAPPPPAPSPKTGLLGGFFSRSAPPPPAPTPSPLVDFRRRALRDLPRNPGPAWLAKLGGQDSHWPGLSARERFALLLQSGDACTLGRRPPSLFAQPDLARLLELVEEVHAAEAGLKTWQ